MMEVINLLTEFLIKTKALPPLNTGPWVALKNLEELNKKLSSLAKKAGDDLIDELERLGHIPSSGTERAKLIQELQQRLNQAEDIIVDEAIEAAQRGNEIMKRRMEKMGIDISQDILPQNIIDNLKNQTGPIVQDTLKDMTYNFKDVLEKGVREGKGIGEVAANLRKERDKLADYRMERVARTETNSAQNFGKQKSLEINNVDFKQWWTGEDERVRDMDEDAEFDHVLMHGQITFVDNEFIHPVQGWRLKYPGEKGGDPGNIINCRCTEAPYVPPQDKIQKLRNLINQNGYAYPSDL